MEEGGLNLRKFVKTMTSLFSAKVLLGGNGTVIHLIENRPKNQFLSENIS